MEAFTTQRFDGKIEAFEPCMIDGTSQQQDISQIEVHESTMSALEAEENHDEIVQNASNNNNISTSGQSNAQQNITLTPVRLPAILDGEFFTVTRLEDSNVTARCLECHKLLNGNLKSTGNFLSHIKRVHPFLMEKIKTKSNQRRPAAIFIDLSSQGKSPQYKYKTGMKKFPKSEEPQSGENSYEQPESVEPVNHRKRKSQEIDADEVLRVTHNNSLIVEDEYDAIGRNVAAKLRHMKVDQRIFAEKLLNDILFEAQMGTLCRDSCVQI